jgi:hypothetical protein
LEDLEGVEDLEGSGGLRDRLPPRIPPAVVMIEMYRASARNRYLRTLRSDLLNCTLMALNGENL